MKNNKTRKTQFRNVNYKEYSTRYLTLQHTSLQTTRNISVLSKPCLCTERSRANHRDRAMRREKQFYSKESRHLVLGHWMCETTCWLIPYKSLFWLKTSFPLIIHQTTSIERDDLHIACSATEITCMSICNTVRQNLSPPDKVSDWFFCTTISRCNRRDPGGESRKGHMRCCFFTFIWCSKFHENVLRTLNTELPWYPFLSGKGATTSAPLPSTSTGTPQCYL